jgi:hypothetical protein
MLGSEGAFGALTWVALKVFRRMPETIKRFLVFCACKPVIEKTDEGYIVPGGNDGLTPLLPPYLTLV